jgi:hypothetical protein
LTPTPQNLAHVISSALHLRQGPSTDYTSIGVLTNGTLLTVLGQTSSGEWLYVMLSDTTVGWLARDFTDFRNTVPLLPTPTFSPTPPFPTPPSPTPSPTAPISGWRGEYYANRTLAGTPLFVRSDAAVQFDWGYGAPGPGLPANNFSVRWTTSVDFVAGVYRFYTRSDDGVRIWIDGELLLDHWQESAAQLNSAVRPLSAGVHVVRVDYFEAEQLAQISIWWEHSGDFPDWRGEYFANDDLSGAPAVIRNDLALDFQWGYAAPTTDLPVDYFSARWTRELNLTGGYYRFHLLMDDGMRLFVDNTLLVADWRNGSVREVTSDLLLSGGTHSLSVEYYEATGVARARVWWVQIDAPVDFPDWQGEYWANRDLSGDPVTTRNDIAVDFDWGEKAPVPNLPADNFSVRWSRKVRFTAGLYRFLVRADDGVRVYADDNRILDEWHSSNGEAIYQVELALEGKHRLRVEYYEAGGQARVEFWWQQLPATSTPTWTPLPANTATPLPTATPSPTATALPTAGATQTPSVTPTSTPINTASATATLVPTAPISATATELPTELPTATPTDLPTATSTTLSLPTETPTDLATATLPPAPTATATLLATETPSATATFTPIATPLETLTSTATVTLVPTAVPSATATATLAPTDTPTEIVTATEAPTPTATPTQMPYAVVTPTAGGPKTEIIVSGGGFPATSVVNIYLGPFNGSTSDTNDLERYATTSTDGNGAYQATLTIPDAWPDGTALNTGKLLILAASEDFNMRATALFHYQAEKTVTDQP